MEETASLLYKTQTLVGKAITQLFDNFKKERLEKRTLESTQEYQQKLNELWTKFTNNHDQLSTLEPELKDHPYFQKAFYDQVREVYEAFSSRISERKQETVAKASTSSKELNDQGDSETSSEIAKYKRRFEGTIMSLERIITNTDEEIHTPQSKAYYLQKLNSIKQYWEQITTLRSQIMAEVGTSTFEESQFTSIEDRYHTTAIQLQERLDELASSGTTKVKLPEIVLPIFDGTYTKWKQFKDLFVQLIHNRTLGSAEKMYYLKANLSGEPSWLVKHLQATGDNYSLAWKILVDRYDNPRTIMTTLLTELLSQPTVASPNSSGIKRIHDTTKECLLSLQNISLRVKEWSPILLHILLQKIDKVSPRTSRRQRLLGIPRVKIPNA